MLTYRATALLEATVSFEFKAAEYIVLWVPRSVLSSDIIQFKQQTLTEKPFEPDTKEQK